MSLQLPEPNLVILGAQKSGTTSLHEYMKRHPDIFMSSPVKEPGYYLGDERAKIFWNRMGQPIESREELLGERMLAGYQGERYFGDASTYYTIDIRSRRFEVPARMHAAHPDMRLIYIMRDPVERIVSNYWHCRAKGRAGDSLVEFLDNPEGRMALETSRYHYQLEAYREYFPPEQFCLLLFEQLLMQPATVMRTIWDFLDLEPLSETGEFRRYNESVGRDDKRVQLAPHEVAELRERLQPELVKLQRDWGVDISDWQPPAVVPEADQ